MVIPTPESISHLPEPYTEKNGNDSGIETSAVNQGIIAFEQAVERIVVKYTEMESDTEEGSRLTVPLSYLRYVRNLYEKITAAIEANPRVSSIHDSESLPRYLGDVFRDSEIEGIETVVLDQSQINSLRYTAQELTNVSRYL